MTETRFYHNPRCSKSRAALELLQQKGQLPRIIRYLETPPTAEEIKALLDKLGIGARQLLRTGEEEYKTLNLKDSNLDDGQLIAAMAAHPKLIERPIFVVGQRAVIGRPADRVLELLASTD